MDATYIDLTIRLSLALLLGGAIGIEHPTSGTSFLEAVAILYVITIAAATADKMSLFYIRKADKNIIKRMIDRCLDDFF